MWICPFLRATGCCPDPGLCPREPPVRPPPSCHPAVWPRCPEGPVPPGQIPDPCPLLLDLISGSPGLVRIPEQLTLPRPRPALPSDHQGPRKPRPPCWEPLCARGTPGAQSRLAALQHLPSPQNSQPPTPQGRLGVQSPANHSRNPIHLRASAGLLEPPASLGSQSLPRELHHPRYPAVRLCWSPAPHLRLPPAPSLCPPLDHPWCSCHCRAPLRLPRIPIHVPGLPGL